MDVFNDESACRICLKKQDTVYSLFRKRKGTTPCENLNKLGVKADENDGGPSYICCDCLAELDITIKFLEKCEKSNQILGQFSAAVNSTQDFVIENSADNVNKACYADNSHQQLVNIAEDSNIDSIFNQEVKSTEVLGIEEAHCGECGSTRRCQHWAPPKTHTCPHCQKVFNRKFNFKLHLARHSGTRGWSCSVCGARAVSRWLASRHCTPRRRRACPVPGCNNTYTTTTNLNTHLRVHSGERPFECAECGKKFTSKNTLNDHMRIHTGELPYICPVCGKRFRTNKLSAHMSTHNSDARVTCARAGCSLRFPSRRALARHSRAHHANAANPARAPHACRLCPATYQHKQSLNKHIKKQHTQKPAPTDTERNEITKEIVCEL